MPSPASIGRPTDATERAPGFFEPLQFSTSPLYSALCPVVAGNAFLRDLALHAQPGQRPEFLFFGAVHRLLLAGTEHSLGDYFPSVVGGRAQSPVSAGPALESFCRQYYTDLLDTIRTRFVQTNHVRRSVGLRAGLALIAPFVDGPVDVIEVGASAGLLLGFANYGYRLHNLNDDTTTRHGDASSPVQIDCDVLGRHPAPDLDALPQIDSATGIDLRPIDPTDSDSRAWLQALVWPEDTTQRQLLRAALSTAAQNPANVIEGDAIDVLPGLGATLPRDHCRVVFHCATRIHVRGERLRAFDAAIRALGDDGPLWEIAIEYPPLTDTPEKRRPGLGMTITDPAGDTHTVAYVNGHLRWFEACDTALTSGRGHA